jgi:hypothetical protein
MAPEQPQELQRSGEAIEGQEQQQEAEQQGERQQLIEQGEQDQGQQEQQRHHEPGQQQNSQEQQQEQEQEQEEVVGVWGHPGPVYVIAEDRMPDQVEWAPEYSVEKQLNFPPEL